MRALLLGAAALLASSSLAVAADDVMANFYGNTVVSTGGMGESHTYYAADHSFEQKILGYDIKGTWALDDKGNLCRTYPQTMPGMPNPLCTPIASHKIGDTWTVQVGQDTRTVTLKAGIQ
jgi:hypothetical protein